jgi:uncharacterized protein YjbI with pentapeptide repeats
MKIEIKHRWSGSVLFSIETDSMKLAVEAAVKQKVSLREADLSEADLRAADLRAANLRAANLSEANLSEADLSEADLSEANLSEANLSEANLRAADLSEANLRAADLRAADLRAADLRAADLREADLRAADLSEADLSDVRDDLWAVLSGAPAEVEGLRAAIAEGRINGSSYEGECACLVGTLANVCHTRYTTLRFVRHNSNRPAERFFMAIKKGDTPETNGVSRIVLEWVDQWLANMKAAFGPKE